MQSDSGYSWRNDPLFNDISRQQDAGVPDTPRSATTEVNISTIASAPNSSKSRAAKSGM